MTTTGLAKHYDALTAAERFVLSLNAQIRGDEREVDRVLAASPRGEYRAPDTFGVAHAFGDVMTHHWIDRLELAASLFQSQVVGVGDTPTDRRLRHLGRVMAANLLICRDGWGVFCRIIGVVGGEAQQGGAGARVLADAEALAEEIALPPDELLAFLRVREPDFAAAPDAEMMGRRLHEQYRQQLEVWKAA